MKNLLLFSIFSFAIIANASVREFRINNTQDSKMGFAIAWGIPGLNVDFEKLDTESNDEIYKFIETNSITNYIVDLKTNTILYKLKNDQKEFSIGYRNFGNHFSIGLEKLTIQGLDVISHLTEAVGVILNYKWSNQLSNILLVDRSKLSLQAIELDGSSIETDIKAQIAKKILPANKKVFNDGATTLTSVEPVILKNVDDVNKMTFRIEVPKSDDLILNLEVLVRLTYSNGKISTQVVSFKQRLE